LRYQKLRPIQILARDRVKVGKEAVTLEERKAHDAPAEVIRVGAQDRIAWYRHERDVPRVDEGQRKKGKGALRADAMDDLTPGIDPGNAKLTLKVTGGRDLKLLDALSA
jgi:hypothetical protein